MSEQFPIIDGRLPKLDEILNKSENVKAVLGQLFIPTNSGRAQSRKQRARGYATGESAYYFDMKKPLLLIDIVKYANGVFELKFLDASKIVEHEIDTRVSYYAATDFVLLPGGIPDSIKNKKVCITGATKLKRDIYRTLLRHKGSFLANNVNRKTDMLVVADFDDSTSKLKKAEKLGIETITEQILTERLIGA